MRKRLQTVLTLLLLLVAVSFTGTAGTALYSTNSEISLEPGDIEVTAKVEGSKVHLRWDIDQIADIKEVIIERSENNTFFRSLAKLEKKSISFRFTDYLLASDLSKRSLFYRVTIISSTGKKYISQNVTVDLGSTKNLKPSILVSGGNIEVDFQSELNSSTQISIFNNTGRTIKSVSMYSRTGDNKEIISSSDLRAGLYFLRIEQNGKVTTTKFFVR